MVDEKFFFQITFLRAFKRMKREKTPAPGKKQRKVRKNENAIIIRWQEAEKFFSLSLKTSVASAFPVFIQLMIPVRPRFVQFPLPRRV